jgi:hypothetical protein
MNVKRPREVRGFVAHITRPGSSTDLCIQDLASPAWAEEAGITWRAPEGTVSASRDDLEVRLVLRDVAGDEKTIEWNPSTQQAVLRCRELWSKPFYYHVETEKLFITDSLRLAVQALPDPPNVDPRALDAYLALEFFPAPLSPFREIRKVGVEETCWIDLRTGTTVHRTMPLPERCSTDFDQALEALRDMLQDALDERNSQCSGGLTLLCSGGLDSTILAHMMRGQGRAIVLSLKNAWKDETKRARQTAHHAAIPLQEISLPAFNSQQFANYASLLDEPIGGTSIFSLARLCATLPSHSYIASGHGSGVLSLMNVGHKHMGGVVGQGTDIVERFSERAIYMKAEERNRLLGTLRDSRSICPVLEMVERELHTQDSIEQALLAVVRRQMGVSEEMGQIWSVYESFGHTPVLPFFESSIRSLFDRLPESVLRTDRYERRMLGEFAKKFCPGYVPQTRPLGSGLPLGIPGYPGLKEMAKVIARFPNGPISRIPLRILLDKCAGTDKYQLFNGIRRLWTSTILNVWLQLLQRQ